MAKAFSPAVLTANDLIEGTSVFLAPEGWDSRISRALVAVTPDQAEELEALGNRHVDDNQIIGPYLVDVQIEGGAITPLLRREQIRADGRPTFDMIPAQAAA